MAGLSGALLLAGCSSNPKTVYGDSGGRIGTSESTAADRYGREVSSVTLVEFADQVAQSLPARITSIPEIANRDREAVMYLGEIENRTKTPSSDFRTVQQMISHDITNSPVMRRHAVVYNDPARVRDWQDRFTSDGPGWSGASMNTPEGIFPASDVFLLNGEMGEISRGRGEVSLYVFDITLVRATDGRVIYSDQIRSKEAR
ncbi:MAG: hypothetical protein DHS20C14_00230 [Phycisphaeraceae bacterium]|nr:MAG: hypothetical protein DHS20C14_00230 [Phycisphaeraceae bacterium]